MWWCIPSRAESYYVLEDMLTFELKLVTKKELGWVVLTL